MKDRIRELMHQTPFRPFTLHLADGREFRIDHPDYIFASPQLGLEILVSTEEGRIHYISAMQITSIDLLSSVEAA